MDQLVQQQAEIGDEVQKTITRYRKQPLERRTASFLEERLQRLQELWASFDDIDSAIRTKYGDQISNDYFTKDYYGSIKHLYDSYSEEISSKFEALQSKEDPHKQAGTFRNSDKATEETQGASGTNPKNTAKTTDVKLTSQFHGEGRGASHDIPTLNPEGKSNIADTLSGLTRKKESAITSLQRLLAGINQQQVQQPKAYYEQKINSINEHWSRIRMFNDQILDLSDNPVSQEYFDVEEQVQEVIIHLTETLNKHCSGSSGSSISTPQMKLPKITIPQFDGDYLKWQQFHDLFLQMIHAQPISKAQKMWFLKTNLTGEAERLIRHFQLSEDNYDSAWEVLNRRYNNKRLQVAALLEKLLGQQTIQTESAFAIRRLHDNIKECLMAINNVGISTATWDPILLHLLLKKLDKTTHNLYEQGLQFPRELQSISQFLEFLEQRFQSLEALGKYKAEIRSPPTKIAAFITSTNKGKLPTCKLCRKNHGIFACPDFLQLSSSERLKTVQRLHLCGNCLKEDHRAINCTSRGCLKCHQRHNTLLHKHQPVETTSKAAVNKPTASDLSIPANCKVEGRAVVHIAEKATTTSRHYVLLGTAVVRLSTSKRSVVECRAILDSGSQLNFISERLANQLGLKEINEDVNIYGIGGTKHSSNHRINATLHSRINGCSFRIEAFTLPEITSVQPDHTLKIDEWPVPKNIALADPTFHQPGPIDLLIGAELYYHLLAVGQIRLGPNLPTLQNTVFGWIVAGKTPNFPQHQFQCNISTADARRLEQQVERFWKLEEDCPTPPKLTAEGRKCETLFAQTTRRDETGRFIVRLPFVNDPSKLGESKDIAYRRFLSLERKLIKNPELRTQYHQFIEEYQRLGHMKECSMTNFKLPYYFHPHHCILKPDSTTTKLRVVFDASARTSTNVSLNDVLATGPTLQDDLFAILLRFRLPRFVFTADIEKMYRQILVHPDDTKYQLIWWRDDPKHLLKCYELRTVTYGTTSAPYLATKCLQQLASSEATKYPQASDIARKDFYVDDLMTGTNSLVEAIEIQRQLIALLKSGGFKLRKWCANHPQLLQNIHRDDRALQLDITDAEDAIKTLGLIWHPTADEFRIKIAADERTKLTKRAILSDISRLFDPLGFLSPVIIKAKIFLQHLWSIKLDWDAALPMDLHSSWVEFRQNLKTLDGLKIPRHVKGGNSSATQVHAFADASERALGAAVYIRTLHEGNRVTVNLLCAKSRVAPLRTTTVPRLELCAAKMAAELVNRVKRDLQLTNAQCYYWTDSEIVLAWINSEAAHYHTFVANRIGDIQNLTLIEQWRHVESKHNPADVLSRGVAPEQLESCSIWFYGPLFLYGPQPTWPPIYTKRNIDVEKKRLKVTLTALESSPGFIHTIDHHNSFPRWQRIIAYMLRFIKNCKSMNSERQKKHLTVQELNDALRAMIRVIQHEEFREDIIHIRQIGHAANNSTLSSLTPFIDNHGIVRVGGRLEASDLPYDAKHPILLPYGHSFTKLLMTDIHLKNLHAGPQTLLAITRQNYWPIKGKTVARSVVGNCIRCTRAKPKVFNQIMGNLPPNRIQPARPFNNAGVDFFGPIYVHYKGRGHRPQKAYVAVFCCFSTKATHFEVVSDLSTQAFIGALKRFVGRRGSCQNLHCDNATNFVGAKNQLAELRQTLHSEDAKQEIANFCTSKGMEFHFIPPRAPHFGGLWEAAVKSAKYFLQRNVASANLTYEELETLMIEIEAILNSRPLTALSADPNDLGALTPGHFLIGEPLRTIRDPADLSDKSGLLTRWKLVAHLKNSFWQRWSREYLSELQHRHKWKRPHNNVESGMMVVVKTENLPPTNWQLGRIVKTIPGEDGLVRVVDVKTASGVFRRPVHKLAPLPMQQEEQEEGSHSSSQTRRGSKHKLNEDNPPLESTSSSSAEPATSTKKARQGRTALNLLLLTCFILPVFGNTDISPFRADPGLYFEKMGLAHLISNEWNLVVYYNLTTYWQEYEALNTGISRLTGICNHLIDNSTCSSTLAQFKATLTETGINNELLKTQHQKPYSRIKRAPFNFIGNVASSLFGTLDSEYAEKMAGVIENLQTNDKHLLGLIKNQTSIIDSTLNIMRGSQEEIEKRFKEVEIYVNVTIHKLNSLRGELYQQNLGQIFTSAALRFVLMISNYQRIQTTLLDVLIDSRHERINPQLLAPNQLYSELQVIQEHIPASLRLPARPDNLLELYNIMTVEGRVIANQMMFRIRLPLFSREQFEMLRIIPVPFLQNNTYIKIKAASDYLIVNLQRDQYYPLTGPELSACILRKEGFNCRQHHPLYRKESNVSSCEISFLTHAEPRKPCDTEVDEQETRWIQLFTPNKWIYTIPNKTTINMICGQNVMQQELSGSGILHLDANCVLNDKYTTIRAQNIYTSQMHVGYTTLRNVTELVRLPSSHTEIFSNEIQKLKTEINQLKDNEYLPDHLNSYDIHQFSVGYLCILLIVVIIGWILWKYKGENFMQRKGMTQPLTPTPLPRTTFSQHPKLEVDPDL